MEGRAEVLLAEYEAAHASFHHYDSFRWQSGALLLAGALVLWGSLISSTTDALQVALASVLISLLLAVWLLYSHHYRQLYMTKLHRIHEIEHELHMKLNRQLGFLGLTPVVQRIYGPKGHVLDASLFVLVSLFGPVYHLLRYGFDWRLLGAVPVIVATLISVHRHERKMVTSYRGRVPGAAEPLP